MLKKTPAAKGNFVQVSLPRAFAESVRASTVDSDRSMASQLEHWAKLARAVEQVLPSAAVDRLKAGASPTEVLSQLTDLLASPNRAYVVRKLENANTPRYGVDETDPAFIIQINPDGTTVRGQFADDGRFVPQPPSQPRKESHAPTAAPVKKVRRRTPRPDTEAHPERGLATA